jgi:hypothetical protein
MTAAAVLLVASCASGGGSGDDADRASELASGNPRHGAATTTTVGPDEPSAAKPVEVAPYIEDLLARYDEAVNKIVGDPEIAEDASDPTVEEFTSLFEPGSDFAAGSIDGWVTQAQQGTKLQPASPDRGVNTTHLEGPPSRLDDDTILFGQCTIQSYVVVENGRQTRREDRKLLPGSGRAVRVDGHWLLKEITTPPDAQGCITGGGVGG